MFPTPTPERIFVVELSVVALSQDEPLSIDLTMFPEAPTPIKVLFPNVTALMLFPVGEVALSQDEPLSVDLTMFPEAPTATNIPEPEEEEEEEELSEEDEDELSVVVEVLSEVVLASSEVVVEDELSSEESSESESVVVVSLVVVILSLVSSLKKGSSPQEMIVRLKRNMERMRSECFTWFPISGLGAPEIEPPGQHASNASTHVLLDCKYPLTTEVR